MLKPTWNMRLEKILSNIEIYFVLSSFFDKNRVKNYDPIVDNFVDYSLRVLYVGIKMEFAKIPLFQGKEEGGGCKSRCSKELHSVCIFSDWRIKISENRL